MLIRTRLASASTSLEARIPTKDNPAPTQESISFALLPTDDRDHLDLDTGEVFQDYNYAKLHKNEQKLIDASITIRPLPDDSYYQYNVMHYLGEQKGDDYYHPSSIHFRVFVAPPAFRELAEYIRRGLFPEAITIELVDDPSRFFTTNANPQKKYPIEYGWEPDGSGMIWHNKEKENKTVAIESVRFEYAPVKPRYDEKQVDRPLPAESNAPTSRINEQIALIQTNLAEMLKYSRWSAMGIAVLAIMIAVLVVKRGTLF
jgi:hypothetical protein